MSLSDAIREAEALVKSAPSIGPYRILESVMMVRQDLVSRTWRERLFSWPWRPHVARRTRSRPRTDVIRAEIQSPLSGHRETVLICHPTVAKHVRESLGDMAIGDLPRAFDKL